MQRAFVIRGVLTDPRRIDLEEPVHDLQGKVEVTLREVPVEDPESHESIFDFVASLSPGTRSKEDIDSQIAEERESWGDR